MSTHLNAREVRVCGPTGLSELLAGLETVLLGKRPQLEMAVACLLARGHLLIEDVPGVGKTTLAQALGASLGLPSARVQFTSDLLPADVVGVSIFDAQSSRFDFRPGPVFTSILLADEINRAPPKAQSALLEAMEERQVTVDGSTHPLDDHFFVIATQNPTDQLGAYPLPESQLDRFLVGLSLGYPEAAVERQLLESGDRRAGIAAMSPVCHPRQLTQWVADANAVHASPVIFDYLLALVQATRTDGGGLSPRAGLNLVKLCRAHALVQGRNHVLPDDVHVAFPALAGHRLTGQVASGQLVARAVLERVPSP